MYLARDGVAAKLITDKNYTLFSLDSTPFSTAGEFGGAALLKVSRLVDGVDADPVQVMPRLAIYGDAGSCEPLCDSDKADAVSNLEVQITSDTNTVLSWTGDAHSYRIFRDGAFIGETYDETFTDSMRFLTDNHRYTVTGLSAQGAETRTASVDSEASEPDTLSVTPLPSEDLVNQAFIETMLSIAIGDPFYEMNEFSGLCDYGNRVLLLRNSQIH